MSRQKDRKPGTGQQEFDFDRPLRRKLVQVIQIPSFHYVNSRGRKVYVHRTATMKDCLKAIESFCGQTPDTGWYLFVEEIAEVMSKDKRTACRAIADCKGGGLLIVITSCFKHVRSHYQIVWKRVAEIIKGNPDTEHHAKHLVIQADGSLATVTHDNLPPTHDKMTLTHDNSSSTHDKMTLVKKNLTLYSRARGLHHDSLPNEEPSWRPNQFAGWPFKIELPHLKHAEAVDRLWKSALQRRDVDLDHTDRHRFFTLARFVARLSDLGEIANPGGYFHAQLVRENRQPNWLGEPCDVHGANKWLAHLDCLERETPAQRAAREGRRK